MKRIALLVLWCAMSAAQPSPFIRILPTDIFSNDARTRTVATSHQLRWTVSMNGCSASMLSPRYLLTAHHCSPRVGAIYTSGGCLDLGCKNDLRVTRIAEQNSGFDSDIVEVEWLRTDSRWRQRYAPRVQVKDTELQLGRDSEATELFTVGFPGDKQKPMYAVGFAKEFDGNYLNYNLGSINGNSGGAVWKTSDFTLVSQTNHGPHQLNQPGWNGNDPEDSKAWNGGPRMSLLYRASQVLKNVFPNGENLDISREGFLIWDENLPPIDP